MIHIGTAGWSIPRAAAELFPGQESHLERFSRTLPCAEINTSFYKPPRASTWLRWAASVPPGFRFAVKAPKAITHESQLASDPAPLRAFLDAARTLGPHLGPILFQLPPKQAFDPARATAFFDLLRTLTPHAATLEPRHPTWFTREASALLARYAVARVAADPAPRHVEPAAAAEPAGSPDLVYYRLHGSPRIYYSAYTPEYLAALAASIRASDAPETWVIFDNTASGAGASDALALARLLDLPAGDRLEGQ